MSKTEGNKHLKYRRMTYQRRENLVEADISGIDFISRSDTWTQITLNGFIVQLFMNSNINFLFLASLLVLRSALSFAAT